MSDIKDNIENEDKANKDKNKADKDTNKADKEKLIHETIAKVDQPSLKAKLLSIQHSASEHQKIQSEKEAESVKKEIDFTLMYSEISSEIQKIVSNQSDINLSQKDMDDYKLDSTISRKEEAASIEGYWAKVLENSKYFHINVDDRKILSHLESVKMEPSQSSLAFKVVFSFAPNEYFENNEIWKEYFFDEDNKSCIKAQSNKINWKSEDKDPRFHFVKKSASNRKQKKKVKVKEKVASFFDFFGDDEQSEEDKDDSDESTRMDEVDYFKEDLFVNQLEYYLNIMEILDGNYVKDEDEEDEDEDNEDDNLKKRKKHKNKNNKNTNNNNSNDNNIIDKDKECKNQ